jgi:hypothetical protein
LNLQSLAEWQKYCRGELPEKPAIPDAMPKNPNVVYKDDGWQGVGDWLGTGFIAPQNRQYLPFKKARAFAHSLNLSSFTDWRRYCKGEMPEKSLLPEDIPSNPNATYKDKGWQGWGDWLDTGTIATFDRNYLPFKKARAFVHTLELKTGEEWKRYCKGEIPGEPPLPENIPNAPQVVYTGKGWISWPDWLGTAKQRGAN